MTTYTFAKPEHRADIIDFINYVFSQSARPHDFKTLIPKVYADGRGYSDIHAIALEGDRVHGVVAQYPVSLMYGGAPLNVGYIGSVSTYPYTRGSGHMRRLMDMQLKRAEETGVDIMLLGGQRQRYEYYGYSPCGVKRTYHINEANVRHALSKTDASGVSFKQFEHASDAEKDKAYDIYIKHPITGARPRRDFELVLGTWRAVPYVILDGERVIGYLTILGKHISEFMLADVSDAARCVKAWYAQYSPGELSIALAPFDQRLNRALAAFAEYCTIGECEQARIVNLKNVLYACLCLKRATGTLSDGCAVLGMDGETPVRARVSNGEIEVSLTHDEPDIALPRLEMQALLFACNRFMAPDIEFPAPWLPLPLYVYDSDHF